MLRQLTIKFLHRVRIHGGEFDSSARAMNRVEESNFFQADLRKFRGSTFERKQMSTTIKRIALVAVAALGLGTVSVAPSSATVFQDSLTLSSATASQFTSDTATATSATATLTYLATNANDSMTVSASLVSAPAGNTVLPNLLLVETTAAVAKNGATELTLGSTSGVAAGNAITVNPKAWAANVNVSAKFQVFLDGPTKVGTYVVKLTPAVTGTGGGTLSGTAQTLTITVTQNAATDTVVASADSILNAGETASATADATVTASKTASTTTASATIKVTLKNAAGVTTVGESYTATIAGPGLLGSADNSGTTIDGSATGRAITVQAGDVVQVYADGSSGVATITIGSAAGVILATEKVTFFGDAATISATVAKTVIGTGSNVEVLEVTVKDAAGVSVSNLDGKLGVVSSDITKISTSYASTGTYDATTGTYLVSVTGVAAGSANLTVTTKASAAATTGVDAAAAVSVRVGSYKPASVKVSTDKTSYAPGEKGSFKVELFDADGLEVVSGETYTAIMDATGVTSSYALQNSTLPAGADVVSYASGGRLYTFYAPVTEGDVKFSLKTGTTASFGVKGNAGGLATANQGVAASITFAVSSAGTSAAIDAANEASQAASDATDAALAAADAADEATTKAQEAVDAVATLSAEVTKMINALKAQIKTLSNLVTKIAKKVRA